MDGPKETDEDQVVIDWLNKYLTARLPNAKDEDELYKIVNTSQKHWDNHSKTCYRTIKHKGKATKKCRFDFPRRVTNQVLLFNRNEDLCGNYFILL